uniref:Uncharacterized protein n=1 Tax=Oryza brachyantha TaxID=4533 RepID=J3N9N0_ORYBR
MKYSRTEDEPASSALGQSTESIVQLNLLSAQANIVQKLRVKFNPGNLGLTCW